MTSSSHDNATGPEPPRSAAKRALLERLMAARAPAAGADPPTIPAQTGDGPAPLAPAQELLWTAVQLVPDSPVFNVLEVVRLAGPLDGAELNRRFNRLLRDQSSLRTTFDVVDGRPVQVVHPYTPLETPVTDLAVLPPSVRDATWRHVVDNLGNAPFDLRTGPLCRVAFLRMDDDEHLAVLVAHHLVADGYSMTIAGSWLVQPDRTAPRVQYLDYVEWQRSSIDPSRGKREEYWRQHLANRPPPLALPLDHDRPASPTFAGRVLITTLAEDLCDRVRELGRRTSATTPMILLAALQALLHEITGQTDLVTGTLSAGRPTADLEHLVGMFATALPVRIRVRSSMPFRALLANTRDAMLGAYANELPLSHITRCLPDSAVHRGPLFEVAFNGLTKRALPTAYRAARVDLPSRTNGSQFLLSLDAVDDGREIALHWWCAADVLEPATVQCWADTYTRLVESATADPDRAIGRLDDVREERCRQLLAIGAPSPSPYPRHRSIHDLVEEQAARAPDAIAVEYPTAAEPTLTYAQLVTRANGLAHLLLDRGVRPGDRVAVLLERSPLMIVAFLAILKVGATYVPLDPDDPAARLELLLGDAAPTLTLIDRQLADRLPTPGPVGLTEPLDEAAIACAATPERPAVNSDVRAPAYQIYTSGSTGMPKGVAVEHHAVVRLVRDTNYVRLSEEDRVAQASTAVFDAATFEIWGPLLNGGRLVGVPRRVVLAPRDLAGWLRAHRITVLFLTTSLFNVVAAESPDALAPLRVALFGGEAADPNAVRAVLTHAPPRDLLHVYGPTESTTFTTWHPVTAVPAGARTVPIGRPIANTSCYVLDEDLLPTAGAPGELFIGGDGLAIGYPGRPAQTADRFVPDPFVGGGARLYRTGDRVRWDEGQRIVFLGRYDDQVKLRGYRIELGEVEATLARHEEVSTAVAAVHPAPSGDGRLVGYVVPRPGAGPDVARRVREFAATELPGYMVPVVVAVDRLPLTASGKVDRAALPAPSATAGEDPSTPREKLLVDIWCDVLGVDSVGVDDVFFELGGDSILAIRIAARARDAGLQIAPQDLFQYPTVRRLAVLSDGRRPGPASMPAPESAEVPLTPIQRRFFRDHPSAPGQFNQWVLFRLPRPLEPARLLVALDAVVGHHEALRLRFRTGRGHWRQYVGAPPDAPLLAQVELRHLPVQARRAAMQARMAQLQRTPDIRSGALFKAALFDVGGGEPQRLLLIGHHLAVDAVSWRTVVADLMRAYAAQVNTSTSNGRTGTGDQLRLPEVPVPFPAWAAHLDACGPEHPLIAAGAAFWAEEAAHRPAAGLLRRDGNNTVATERCVEERLDERVTGRLVARTSARTGLDDLVLAAAVSALATVAGLRELTVDVEGHGRDDPIAGADLSRTVGWLTSMYPVRIAVDPPYDDESVLATVTRQRHSAARHAFAYGVLDAAGDGGAAAELSFNHLGRIPGAGTGGAPADAWQLESSGLSRDPDLDRGHLLRLESAVVDGQLELRWFYSYTQTDESAVNAFVHRQVDALRALATQGGADG